MGAGAPAPRLRLVSDEHRAYLRALARLERLCEIAHVTVSSKLARTPQNLLFAANLLDLLIRHCSANQKRETIAFSKRRQAALERIAIFLLWRNYMKRFSENRRTSGSPAMRLKLADRLLTVDDVLSRRLFPSQVRLHELWQRYYDREVETRQIPGGRRHRASYAY